MSHARAEDGSTLELLPDLDCWPTLQPFCDAHACVQLPAGTWNLSRPLNLKPNTTLRGMGQEATTLRRSAAFDGPVVGMGGAARWAGSAGYGTADNVTLAGMTVWQTQAATANNKCVWQNDGRGLLVENVRLRGAAYEGLVVGSLGCNGATIRNCEAWDCGNGGPAYTQSTAGFNATSVDLLVEDCRTLRCGQGIETGNTRVTVRRCVFAYPGGGTPAIGINIGSSVCGVYQTTIEDCVTSGYDDCLEVGNGIGRCCAVFVRRCTFYDDTDAGGDPAVQFAGGIADNLVPHADQGPDTEGSEITDNVIYSRRPHQGSIGYNSGITNNGGVLGREPLLIARNRIVAVTVGPPPLDAAAPVIFFAGRITAPCVVDSNVIDGLYKAPVRGDIASFTLIDNPAVPGMPNLQVLRNQGTYNGDSRPLVVRIEGA